MQLLPGANALAVAAAVKRAWPSLQPSFPQGRGAGSRPTTAPTSSRISVNEVVKTLVEAMVLVFLVMLLFLQNLRATMIPTLVIPVALLGTFLGMKVLGFTINQLSLFGMVLAIGIVVDDAIVVIENVERIMTEEGLPPREATRKAMHQITGAVIAITRGAGGGVHPERAAGRLRRRGVQAVRADHRDGDGVLGVPRAGVHAGAVRQPAQAQRAPRQAATRSSAGSTRSTDG